MNETSAQHQREISAGDRFKFGANWWRFLRTITEERIRVAEDSLRRSLGRDDLAGLSFLDVGTGSGLFSLAARRLSARVRSFDYDPKSVMCACELKYRLRPDDPDWAIDQGSVLDHDFLTKLGQFDIVYSWGVLHHTGAMQQSFENIIPLVKPGGTLFIAIYNDCGEVTDRWLRIKKTYCRLPLLLKLPYALRVIAPHEYQAFRHFWKQGNPMGYIRYWTNYRSDRGMSRWYDWIDWIGGYPYECASAESLADYFESRGFSLQRVKDCSGGIGCHELVFAKAAEDGSLPPPIRFGQIVARRSGLALPPPTPDEAGGWSLSLDVDSLPGDGIPLLFVDQRLVGVLREQREDSWIKLTPVSNGTAPPDPHRHSCRVVRGNLRRLDGPFERAEGYTWMAHLPDLAGFADNVTPSGNGSSLAVFEDGVQLCQAHAQHQEIAQFGKGRYSHWGEYLRLSPSDNSDPNANGRVYYVIWGDLDRSNQLPPTA